MTVKLMYVTTIPMTLEFFMRGQIPYMCDRGFEVSAVSSPDTGLKRVAERDGISVFPVPMERGVSPWGDFLALMRLVGLFLRVKPTIVHASTGKAGPLAIIAAKIARVPVKCYGLRGVMIDRRTGLAHSLLRMFEKAACGLSDRVLAVSPSVAEHVVHEGLCPRDKITVPARGSSNGVDALDRFNPDNIGEQTKARFRNRHNIPRDALVIGFVGRIVAGKGVRELALAWNTIRTNHPHVRLILAGPVESQDPVPDQVLHTLGNDDRVTMLDYVPNEQMPLFYSVADLIVLPSYSEGFPNVPLEAAAMELPVVATTVTGCIDAVVDGITGILVPARDAGALERAMATYLVDDELRRLHGKAGRERVLRDFRPEPLWEAVYSQYQDLLEKKGLDRPST